MRSILVKIFLFAVFVIADPFGLASSVSSASEQLVYRALSLFQSRDDREHTTVVLIDDASATSINGERGHPLTFAQHAAVLRPILCAGPAALLIDITFRGIRSGQPVEAGQTDPELQALLDVLGRGTREEREYCQSALPSVSTPPPAVFIARARSNPPSPCDPLFGLDLDQQRCTVGLQLDKLARVAEPVSVAPVSSDGSYPLVIIDKGPNEAVGQARQSPALALALAYCGRLSPDARAGVPGCRDQDRLGALTKEAHDEASLSLYPLWPYYLSKAWLEDQQTYAGAEAAGEKHPGRVEQARSDRGLVDKLSVLAAEGWHALIQPDREREHQLFGTGLLLPFDTFSAIDVVRMVSRCGTGGDCERRLKAFFTGRVVVYGLDVTGINDKVASPVLGAVPGAAFHAIVADNLLRRGAHHLHPSPAFGIAGLHVKLSDLLDILFYAITLAVTGRVSSFLLKSRWYLQAVVLLPALLSAVSLAPAVCHDLALAKAVVGGAGLLVAILLMLYALEHGLPPTTGGDTRRSERAELLLAGGRYLIGISIALPLLVVFATVVLCFLNYPPTNVIATLLIYSEVAGESESSATRTT